MKKVICLLLLLFIPAMSFAIGPRPNDVKTRYHCIGFTGNLAQHLDALDIISTDAPNKYDLVDGDSAIVNFIHNNEPMVANYRFYASATDAEDTVNIPPEVVRPDDYVTNAPGVWKKVDRNTFDNDITLNNHNINNVGDINANNINGAAGNFFGNVTTGNAIFMGPEAVDTEAVYIKLGQGRTGEGNAHIDFIGDDDSVPTGVYGLRIRRHDGGENATSEITHRGTGDFQIDTEDAASIKLRTNSTTRMTVLSDGVVRIGDNSDSDATITFDSDTDDLTLNWDEANSEVEFDAPNYRLGDNADENIVIVLDANTNDATLTYNKAIDTLEISSDVDVGRTFYIGPNAVDNQDALIKLGYGRTGEGNAYIDFVGDDDTAQTQSYGLRLRRYNTGANAGSALLHRGTGSLNLTTENAGAIKFKTNNIERMSIGSGGEIVLNTESPAATDPCTKWEIKVDASYIYVCTASGVWKRAALTGGY